MPCKELDRDVFQDQQVGAYVNANLVSVKIHGKKGEGPEIATRFGLRGYPTVLFLGQNGEEIERILGFDGDRDTYFQMIRDYAVGRNTFDDLQNRIKANPEDVEVNFRLAKKHVAKYEEEQAQHYFQAVVQLDPDDRYGFAEESQCHLAVFAARTGKSSAALQEFISSTQNTKLLKMSYVTLLGLMKRSKNSDEVIAAYEKAVARLSGDANLMNGFAWYIYEENLADYYDRGIEIARRALEIEPNSSGIWDTLAWLYFENGDRGKAVAAMKRAAELDPDTEIFKTNLEKMQQESGS
jgi:tetratricopeptide (TPR) repeat protein